MQQLASRSVMLKKFIKDHTYSRAEIASKTMRWIYVAMLFAWVYFLINMNYKEKYTTKELVIFYDGYPPAQLAQFVAQYNSSSYVEVKQVDIKQRPDLAANANGAAVVAFVNGKVYRRFSASVSFDDLLAFLVQFSSKNI